MIDIHCHILDGIDDGADCLPESVEMAKIARQGGTLAIVATPHANIPGSFRNVWSVVLENKVQTLNEQLKARRISVTVYPGQEVFCTGDIVRKLKDGALLPLNRSRYLLIEFDFYERTETFFDRSAELLAEGVVPVIAHPERYEALQENDDVAYRLKKSGCLLQLNSGSLFGAYGRSAQRAAHSFLSDSLADFIASDAHSPYVRTPFMADAHEVVSEMYSLDYAELLFRENPVRLLADKDIKAYY